MEELGSQPIEDEIPIELQDFAPEIQQIIELYTYLPDKISDSTGIFMGKLREGLPLLLNTFCFGIDVQYVLEMLSHVELENISIAVRKHNSKNKVNIGK